MLDTGVCPDPGQLADCIPYDVREHVTINEGNSVTVSRPQDEVIVLRDLSSIFKVDSHVGQASSMFLSIHACMKRDLRT